MKWNSQHQPHPQGPDAPALTHHEEQKLPDNPDVSSAARHVHRMNQLANTTTLPMLDSTLLLLRTIKPHCPDWRW